MRSYTSIATPVALYISGSETDYFMHQLTETRGLSPTEAINPAVRSELRRGPLAERLKTLREKVVAETGDHLGRPRTDKEGKAFYDDLDGSRSLIVA